MKRLFLALFSSFILSAFALAPASAGAPKAKDGWKIHTTQHAYADLVDKVRTAVKDHKMGLVTTATASGGAKRQGITIPGNRIIGVYRNDFARRMLAASISAGIEAPIRFYVTEDKDGTATLSYKTPTHVFSPYFDEGGEALKTLASELDDIFASIATQAIAN